MFVLYCAWRDFACVQEFTVTPFQVALYEVSPPATKRGNNSYRILKEYRRSCSARSIHYIRDYLVTRIQLCVCSKPQDCNTNFCHMQCDSLTRLMPSSRYPGFCSLCLAKPPFVPSPHSYHLHYTTQRLCTRSPLF